MRTAVIAVHGVGSPERNATARAVADLLVKHGAPDAEYREFRETCITLPVDRLDVGDHDVEKKHGLHRLFIGDSDRTRLSETSLRFTTESDGKEVPEAPDVTFMRQQLENYRSAHEPFDTVELVGRRMGQGGAPPRDVHIFEMYWADLSRLGSGVARVFGALFQLIQHISHLGRKALDVAAEVADTNHAPEARAWSWYAGAHAMVVRLFTIFVPVTSLLMLSFVVLFVPAAIPSGARLLTGIVVAGLALLVGTGLLFFTRSTGMRAVSAYVWSMLAAVSAAIGAFAALRASAYASLVGTALLTIVLGAVTFLAFRAIVRRYDRSRSGAYGWGMLVLGIVAVLTAYSSTRLVLPSDPAEAVRHVAFLGFQWSFLALTASWGALWMVTIAAFVIYAVVVRRDLRQDRTGRARAIRAAWTARVTLAASVFSYIVIALVAYGSVIYVAVQVHQHFDLFPHVAQGERPPTVVSTIVPPDLPCLKQDTPTYDPSSCSIPFFQALVAAGGTSGLLVALIGAGAALVLISWFIALIAYTAMKDLDRRRSVPLGNWMTGGFAWSRHAGTLFAITTLGAIVVGAALDWLELRGMRLSLGLFSTATTQTILNDLTIAVVASAATVAAFRARLDVIANRVRPALGILLDVDNYLRESPDEATPRARIAERFSSLMRHVVERTDENGQPFFDRIVIVSHSQGTVISADFLRFLKLTGAAPGLVDERVHLLTMGSPLRQLYAENFPHLYEWIDRSDDAVPAGAGPYDDDDAAKQVVGITTDAPDAGALTGRSPSPLWLGVSQWVNLFTTGDYIGRTLWRHEEAATWQYQDASSASCGSRRRERCLGAGTHTHYWTSADVAEEIDRLVAAATTTTKCPPAAVRTTP